MHRRRPTSGVVAWAVRPRRVAVRLLGVGIGLVLCGGLSAGTARARTTEPAPLATVRVDGLPVEGRDVLARIRSGARFASPRDGAVFGNREQLLPRRPRGYYAEFTVPTPGARNRGARRIVAGQGTNGDPRPVHEDGWGEYYYTDDHYQSFRRIVR